MPALCEVLTVHFSVRSSQQRPEMGDTIIPISEIKKLRCKGIINGGGNSVCAGIPKSEFFSCMNHFYQNQ